MTFVPDVPWRRVVVGGVRHHVGHGVCVGRGSGVNVIKLCSSPSLTERPFKQSNVCSGNTKGGSITVPLFSCLTGLESGV